jgi:hypothetical protein
MICEILYVKGRYQDLAVSSSQRLTVKAVHSPHNTDLDTWWEDETAHGKEGEIHLELQEALILWLTWATCFLILSELCVAYRVWAGI